MFATVTNIASYLPFLTLTGDVGKFIYSLPMVLTLSLVSSRIVSMTFIPLLGKMLLRPMEPARARMGAHGEPVRGQGVPGVGDLRERRQAHVDRRARRRVVRDADNHLHFSGKAYRTSGPSWQLPFDSSAVHLAPVGTADFAPLDATHAVFTYDVDGVAGSRMLERWSL